MKKLLLILLLVPTLLVAQNRPDWDYDFQQPISTDFPNKLPFYRNYLPLQNTYYELNVTLNNVRQLVTHYLKMNPKGSAPSGSGFQYEIYTNPTHRSPLKVKYNTFTVYGLEVVKSIEIEGDFADVAKVFIYMYDTNFSTNQTPVNKAVKPFKHDYAVFTVMPSGKASINITNSKYGNNTASFIKDFNEAKEQFKKEALAAKQEQEQKRIEEEAFYKQRNEQFEADQLARKEENAKALIDAAERERAKPITTIHVYYFSKLAKKVEFRNKPSTELEKLILDKVSGYKKGNYSAYVTTTSVLENKTYDIKINQRQH